MNRKITVAIVCYNSSHYIGGVLDSLRNQNKLIYELVIIDGKSADGTLEIINAYDDIVDVLISEKDDGIYDAMNKALKIASGNWILFLGSDDKLVANLEHLLKYLKNKDEVYYGDCKFFHSGKIYDGKFNAQKIFYRNICHQAVFYPKKMYKNQQYNCKYKIRADHAYNILGYFQYSYNYLPIIVSIYNDKGLSSLDSDQHFQKDRLMLYKQGAPFWLYSIVCARYYLVSLLKRFIHERQ